MNPEARSHSKRKRRKQILLIISCLILVFVGLCSFFRISKPSDFLAYGEMVRIFPPIWKEFAFRHVSAGDSTELLFQRHSPSSNEEFGRYGVYDFYPGDPNKLATSFVGLTVITKDGKLSSAKAWSCTCRFDFFDTPDTEFSKEYSAFRIKEQAAFEQRQQKKLEEKTATPLQSEFEKK